MRVPFFAYGIFRHRARFGEDVGELVAEHAHVPGRMYVREEGGIAFCKFFQTYEEAGNSHVVGDVFLVDEDMWQRVCRTEYGMYYPVLVRTAYQVGQNYEAIAWEAIGRLNGYRHVANGDWLKPKLGKRLLIPSKLDPRD